MLEDKGRLNERDTMMVGSLLNGLNITVRIKGKQLFKILGNYFDLLFPFILKIISDLDKDFFNVHFKILRIRKIGGKPPSKLF